MQSRDSGFIEHLNNFMSMNSPDHNNPTLPLEKSLNIPTITIGASAGGMNSATYSMAIYYMSRAHKPFAIYNVFTGLTRHESINALNWPAIINWNNASASELGTDRKVPEDSDISLIALIAYYSTRYKIDGLQEDLNLMFHYIN
ncbi:uncharacterized protein ASCRUDRAFT_81959 [Ascoidea rubescens DSM 1968]|uniref:Phosphofructokinase domain-containing protein n=1 Tax=Ascoidea rubescens DSM 1968 TaxID=1344418 RepID=A0A1D2VDM0_9ASCO|nr:hypothetical protein ASCRUDRAFT_81959 [Ascoidea rubescens DSM 1968]ODV59682.1 hypothetical protein ASCRUDRAFT_81959 [Ascoidea rubescens DSM 1968]